MMTSQNFNQIFHKTSDLLDIHIHIMCRGNVVWSVANSVSFNVSPIIISNRKLLYRERKIAWLIERMKL